MVTAATESFCPKQSSPMYLDGCMLMLWCCHKYCASNLSSIQWIQAVTELCSGRGRRMHWNSVCDKWKLRPFQKNPFFCSASHFSRLSSFKRVIARAAPLFSLVFLFWFSFLLPHFPFQWLFHFYCCAKIIHWPKYSFVGRHKCQMKSTQTNDGMSDGTKRIVHSKGSCHSDAHEHFSQISHALWPNKIWHLLLFPDFKTIATTSNCTFF